MSALRAGLFVRYRGRLGGATSGIRLGALPRDTFGHAPRSVTAVWRTQETLDCRIGYVARAKPTARGTCYLRAEVEDAQCELRSLFIDAAAVREYFYNSPYTVLRASPDASFADLRLAYRLALLERPAERAAITAAFDILGDPELRAMHNAPEEDCVFPHSGFGAIRISGQRSSDDEAFFARRILEFTPHQRRRQFRAALRRCDFYDTHAVLRDGRRKVVLTLDPSLTPFRWDATWNQWKHLLGLRAGVSATFVESGAYRQRGGEWKLSRYEVALPSTLAITFPSTAAAEIERARVIHRRLGQYFDALEPWRARTQREPVDSRAIEAFLQALGAPGDLQPHLVTWQPDYEEFYFNALRRRARSMHLWRNEYVFQLDRGVAAEIPQIGHATYLFQTPSHLKEWLAIYTGASRQDIRTNRSNVAERLGFVGRLRRHDNPKKWLRELETRVS